MIFINVTLTWINICTSASDYEGQYITEKDQKQVMQNMCNNLICTWVDSVSVRLQPTFPCRWRSRARHAVMVVLPLPLAGADRKRAGQQATEPLLDMMISVLYGSTFLHPTPPHRSRMHQKPIKSKLARDWGGCWREVGGTFSPTGTWRHWVLKDINHIF